MQFETMYKAPKVLIRWGDGEFTPMEPPQSRETVVATLLERYLKKSARVGLRSSIVTGFWYVFYIGGGAVATTFGWFDPPYPFLSLEADPIFLVGSTIVGLFIVQFSSSLLLYHFLVGFEDERSRLSVLMGFISLGFGGAILRVALPATVKLLLL